MKHQKHFIRILILLALLSATAFARAQSSFDPKGGCLNVVDISHGQKLSEYGDKCKICCSIEHKIKENVYLCAKSRQENV